ncbi:MAG: hydrogenase maturation factor [Blautia sp.]|nr:hydrogenase maturation factor [Blautia sp.]
MRPGPEELEALQKEITGKMVPGDDIVILGPVGIAGTLQLLKNCADRLKAVFSAGFLADAEEDCLSGRILPSDIQKLTDGREVHAMYGLGPAGFLGGLWIMAEASSAGLKLDLRRVPILQYSVEICEVTGDNPYMIPSEGTVLLSMQSGEAFASEMRRQGIRAACAGEVNSGNDRLLYSGSIVRYLDKPPRHLRPGYAGEDRS